VKKLKYIPVLFLIPYLLFVAKVNAQNTEVSGVIIDGPTVSLISIAVNDFQLDENLVNQADTIFSTNLKNTLVEDLTFTLYFSVVKPDSAFITDFAKGEMKLDDWIYLGARMLVKGRLDKHDELYTLNLEVIDIFQNSMVYNNEFLGSEQSYRAMSHRIAADLLLNLTGEAGVFDSKIAYSSQIKGNRDIYICDFDGYNTVKITDDAYIDQMPAWSHNGDRIYFTSDRHDNHDLYCYIFEKNEVYSISNREGLNFAAAPSPDGNYISVTLSIAGNSEIYLLDPSGRIMRRLAYSPRAIDTSPTWSPNSKEIAYISDRAGNPQLYVIDVDGTNSRRLTYYGDYIADPVWSPRGDYIAYCSREAGQFQIYIVDITGQNAYKLTEIASNEAPSWSPDGLHIVYSSNIDGPYSLWIMNFDGSGKRRLNLGGNCKSPSWSVNLR
jgi:TolB protein